MFDTPSLLARSERWRDEYAWLWATTREDLPVIGPSVGVRRHWENARAASRLIDELAAEVDRVPDGEDARRAWQDTVRERLQRFGDARLGWPTGYRRLVFGDAFFAASKTFAREARAFDPEFSVDSLFQALRNVWIGNSLQMLFDLPVVLTPGLFAYKDLIRRNCITLLVGAVAEQPRCFTRGFRRTLASQWPFSIRATGRLRRRVMRRYGEATHSLERRTGATSVIDWFLTQSDAEALVRQSR